MAVAEADLSTLKRIERLPFSRFHWRLLWMGGLGYTFDAMDGAMIAFILPVVSSLWGLTNQQTGILGSSLMIGYLFGPSSRARWVIWSGRWVASINCTAAALAFAPK